MTKLCLGAAPNLDQAGMQKIRQIGVNHVLMGRPALPWTETDLRARMEHFKAGGLTVRNLTIYGFPNCIYFDIGMFIHHEDFDKSFQPGTMMPPPPFVAEYQASSNTMSASSHVACAPTTVPCARSTVPSLASANRPNAMSISVRTRPCKPQIPKRIHKYWETSQRLRRSLSSRLRNRE